jgi:hypothetical protein
VPQFDILTETGTKQYAVHQPVCCGGLCVDICAEGLCNCRIPFYVYPPGASGEKGSEVGKIVKVWGGLSQEIFTDADTFELKFPADANYEAKLRLLGAVFLLNQIFFESSKDQSSVPLPL